MYAFFFPEIVRKRKFGHFWVFIHLQGGQNYLPARESKIELWAPKFMVDTQILQNLGNTYLP